MSADKPAQLIQCPGCGRMVSGAYCSYCGEYLVVDSEEKKKPFLSFAKHFLNLDNIGHYLKLYFTILRKPVINTIRVNKEIHFETAVKFIEYSVVLFSLFAVTKSAITPVLERGGHSIFGKWEEKITELLDSILIVISYLIVLKLFYRWASKRFGERDKREYIKLYCLYAGFYLPIFGLAILFLGNPYTVSTDGTKLLLAIKLITWFLLNIAILFQGFYIWGDFWRAPGNKVVALLMFAGLTSFVIFFVAKVIIYMMLNIDL
jgi:hypothetical protein